MKLIRRSRQAALARTWALAGAQMITRDQGGTAWAARVDLDSLRMEHPAHCVLGQVYGDYHRGLVTLGLWRENPRIEQEHGFTLLVPFADGITFRDLNRAWQQVIRELR